MNVSENEGGYRYLSRINSPADLKSLDIRELGPLSEEIRAELLRVVALNGGHLASNLGVVELTVALHYVFDSPTDKLIWDVGHQGYVHKLLTGRRKEFESLRKYRGCAGFLSRQESEHDVFGAGHAGTAISAALGLAAARDARHGQEKVVAVVGDGSLNCGISLEGLNNIHDNTRNFIIVLNDNKMSISENVGAIPRCLNRIISGRSYNRFKAMAKVMLNRLPHGGEIRRTISRLEEATKSLFVPGVLFEELGIRYLGPIDGHDFYELVRTLEAVRDYNRPVLVHVITEKGRGYDHAERAPEKFHGMGSFDPSTGNANQERPAADFSGAFGNAVLKLAERNGDVAAVTAAMCSGTGLKNFAEKMPARFYDVGIAEEHALVFAAGLAAGGMRPVVAIYSTFMQRGLDNVFHDICLQGLPVIMCQDRSGVVEDGPTHHGIYDLGFLLQIPGLTVMQPMDESELHSMLFAAYELAAPVVIRYPKGSSGRQYEPDMEPERIDYGRPSLARGGHDAVIWAVGNEVSMALAAAGRLEREHQLDVAVVNTRFLKPFDREKLLEMASKMPVVTLEDNHIGGGLGGIVDSVLSGVKHRGVSHLGWGDQFVPHGELEKLRHAYGMDEDAIVKRISEFIRKTRRTADEV